MLEIWSLLKIIDFELDPLITDLQVGIKRDCCHMMGDNGLRDEVIIQVPIHISLGDIDDGANDVI